MDSLDSNAPIKSDTLVIDLEWVMPMQGFSREGGFDGKEFDTESPMQVWQHPDGRRVMCTAEGNLFCKCDGLMNDVRSCLLKTVAVLNVTEAGPNRKSASSLCHKCAEIRERALCELAKGSDD